MKYFLISLLCLALVAGVLSLGVHRRAPAPAELEADNSDASAPQARIDLAQATPSVPATPREIPAPTRPSLPVPTELESGSVRTTTITSPNALRQEVPQSIPSALASRMAQISAEPTAVGFPSISIGDNRFESEAVDPAWAPGMESLLYSVISATTDDVLQIEAIECRTTVCRAIVDYGDSISQLDEPARQAKFERDFQLFSESLGPLAGNSNGIGPVMANLMYEQSNDFTIFMFHRGD